MTQIPQDARIAARVLRRVQARNRELAIEATIEAGMGILFTALTSGVVFCIAWFVCISIAGGRFPSSTVALCVTAVFFVVGMISAWRHVNPFAGLKPMSGTDHLLFAVSGAVGGYMHMNRHTVAGLALVLMGGPENLVGALRTWLHRLPSDPAVIDQAAGILTACRPEVDLKRIDASVQAAILLRRLNLIVPRGDSTTVTLTEKGRNIVEKDK
ncbi:MAG: hypothetical protein HY290_09695 [Planctomycetia bacterium]|nr:hypothetical protein [Planctomycetia bacterium]